MRYPSKEWPFISAPEMVQGEKENSIMATRRKMYALLQSWEQESDENYNVNIVSTVRVEK